MSLVKEEKIQYDGVIIHLFGVKHRATKELCDVLGAKQDCVEVILVEAKPDGFDWSNAQEIAISQLEMYGTPIVMGDTSRRLSRKEALEEYGEETIEKISDADSRKEIREISSQFYTHQLEEREDTFVEKIRELTTKADCIAVIIGRLHLSGVKRKLKTKT